MHAEVIHFLSMFSPELKNKRVVDLGGRNVNGSPRQLFEPVAEWTAVDRIGGPDVDICADLAMWQPSRKWDVVVCTEVLEHALAQDLVLLTAAACMEDDATLLLTAACDPRHPHSAIDGAYLAEDHAEEYLNVDPCWLLDRANALFLESQIRINYSRGDVYLWAKGKR